MVCVTIQEIYPIWGQLPFFLCQHWESILGWQTMLSPSSYTTSSLGDGNIDDLQLSYVTMASHIKEYEELPTL